MGAWLKALAAVANPDDLQVAGNLGVALDSIPDSKAASAVLLYARKLAPHTAVCIQLSHAGRKGGKNSGL